MSSDNRPSRPEACSTALWVAIACAAIVLAWQYLTVTYNYDGNWTGLFCTGERSPIPPALNAGTWRFAGSNGYDGQFYRYAAHDPLFLEGYRRYFDDSRLRYRRVLLPLLAYGLVWGRDSLIDAAYIGLILLSVALGVYWTGRWFARRGRHPAWGAVFLLVPATLTSIDRMLLDGPLVALFAGFAFYVETGSTPRLWAILAIAPLVKETGAFLIAGQCLWELLQRRVRRAILFSLAGAPWLAWLGFVTVHTPPSYAWHIIQRPIIGHFERLLRASRYPLPRWQEAVMQTVDVLAMLGLLASCVIALWWMRRKGFGPVGVSTVFFVALALAVGNTDHLTDAYGYARPIAPMLWFVMVNGIAESRWLLASPPVAMSMQIGFYFLHQAIMIVKALAR